MMYFYPLIFLSCTLFLGSVEGADVSGKNYLLMFNCEFLLRNIISHLTAQYATFSNREVGLAVTGAPFLAVGILPGLLVRIQIFVSLTDQQKGV